MQKDIINQALEYVKKMFENEYSGHDYFHTLRVFKMATHIAEKENADVEIVQLAALLHDVDDFKLSPETYAQKTNARSFLQVNDEVKNLIYQKIIDTLGSQKNVIDAYSGAGLLSSIIAKNGANVYGIEIIKEATENANKLKFLNDLYNLTNKNGDCAKIIPELAKELKGNFSVVVDPPRKGLDDMVVEVFLKTEPKMIVYLSCNPATLARDLSKLTEKYKIDFIQPYDMFPQTANVETLVCLKLK